MITSANMATIDHKLQGFTELQDEYDKIRFLEPLITHDLNNVVEENGTKLDGLQYSVKTASSITDKMERITNTKQGKMTPKEALEKMTDLIRYTQICEHNDIFTVARQTIEALTSKGYMLSKVQNYYETPYKTTGYKGLHLNFISPQGQVFELQIHSEESFAAKQKGHELYEVIRAVSTPIEKKNELRPEIFRIHNTVPNPPGYNTLHNFMATKEEIKTFITSISEVEAKITRTDDITIFSLMQNEKVLTEGLEIELSDRSAIVMRSIQEKDAHYMDITQEGTCSKEEKIDPKITRRIGTKEAQMIKNAAEYSSAKWMQAWLKQESTQIINAFLQKMDTTPKIIHGILDRDPIVIHVANGDIKGAADIFVNQMLHKDEQTQDGFGQKKTVWNNDEQER